MRVLAAAALPPIGVTLYLTFSRGAIWALPVGFVLYVLLAQPRGLVTARRRRRSRRRSRSRSPTAPSCWRAPTTTRRPRRASQGRHVGAGRARVLRWPRRRCGRPRCRWTRGWRRSGSSPTRVRLLRSGSPAGSCSRSCVGALAADAPRRISDARATFSRGPLHGLLVATCATRLTSAVDNGRIDNWRVALDGFERAPAARHRRRHLPDHLGPLPPGAAGEGQRRPLALPGDAVGARGRRAGAAAGRARDAARRAGCCGSAGRSATPTARSSPAGAMLAVHAAIDWDWEMPALFVWLFGAGGVALAARAARGSGPERSRGTRRDAARSSPRWPCSCWRSRRRCSRSRSRRWTAPSTRSRGATAGRRSTRR